VSESFADRFSDDKRLEDLVDLTVELASGNLSARLIPSPARDSVDAVITGINLLAEELDQIHRTLEQRVAERTVELDQARREMEHLALNDPLTGLANRMLLGDRIGQATARADRGEQPPSVLLLDLDEFKTINDGLGHSAGDRILVEVARRLAGVVRETDTVARLGGDEFAILMPGVTEDDALRIAQRALEALQKPFTIAHRAVWAGASIGVCFGRRGQTAELLLRDADTAMYAAKSRGRGNIQVFRPEMHAAARERLRMASELGVAVAQHQLRLHYQPIVELATGEMVAAEAKIRWMHPRRGLLLPEDFIAVAEDSGRIVEIGHWVLRTGVAQLRAWQEKGLGSSFQLHLNMSSVELRWPGLTAYVARTLEEQGIEPTRLALEISETGLMTGDVAGLEALLALSELGLGVEIDDFGTGYSSTSWARRLPIDTVKVHQTLIKNIATDAEQSTFVEAILRLIQSIGMRAIVDGISTTAELRHLQALGCVYGQGSILHDPLPADGMERLLAGRSIPARG